MVFRLRFLLRPPDACLNQASVLGISRYSRIAGLQESDRFGVIVTFAFTHARTWFCCWIKSRFDDDSMRSSPAL